MRTPRALIGAAGVVLDTNVFIYCFEDHPEYGPLAEHVLAEAGRGRFRGVVTPITVAELLVKPLRAGRADIAARYRSALESLPNIEMAAFDASAGAMAGALRAKYGLPLPDMCQAAIALRSDRPSLVSHDRALRQMTEMAVVDLEDFR